MQGRHSKKYNESQIQNQNLSSKCDDPTPSRLPMTAATTTYRGIDAGVTESGVKRGGNGSTRVSAADCRGDGMGS